MGTQQATANVPGDKVTFIDHKLNDDYSKVGAVDGAPEYQRVVNEIRAAAGWIARDEVRVSQHYRNGVIGIVVRNHLGIEMVTIYLNPHSLYLAGFQTRNNRSYYFSDARPEVVEEIQRHARTFGHDAIRLNLTGKYDDWLHTVQVSNLARPTYLSVRHYAAEANFLGGLADQEQVNRSLPQIARAFLTLEPAYSQALMFTRFRDSVSDGMHDMQRTSAYNLSSPVLQEWRDTFDMFSHGEGRKPAYLDHWGFKDGALNDVFIRDTLPKSYYVGPWNGTLHTWEDVRANIRMFVHNLQFA